jgi:hypothetical protein
MMSARVLLNGVLEKPPVRLTSKAGKPYLRASARDGNGPDAKWWTIFAFAEAAIEAIKALTLGEAFAASGPFEASVWAPEGREPRVNLTMTADAVLSARKPKRADDAVKYRPKAARNRIAVASNGRKIAEASWAHPTSGGDLSDDIPF